MEEKLQKLDQLSNAQSNQLHGGVSNNDSIPTRVPTFSIPPLKPTPNFSISIKPGGGGTINGTITF
jgi:hypothetical protein